MKRGMHIAGWILGMLWLSISLFGQFDSTSSMPDSPREEDRWTGHPSSRYTATRLRPQEGAQEEWVRLRKKIHYAPEEKPKKKGTRSKEPDLSSLGEMLRVIGIILGILLVGGFLLYLIQGGNFRKARKVNVDLSDERLDWIEENLPEADVESPLAQAIRLKEFRKAVRLYFLLTIQNLSNAGEIIWKKDKTNRAYVFETRNKSYAGEFQDVVRIFERIWYGEREINEEEFEKIALIFKDLNREIETLIEVSDE